MRKMVDYIEEYSDVAQLVNEQIPLYFNNTMLSDSSKKLNVLSLFSGCGGMDLGFEGGFKVYHKCVNPSSGFVESIIDNNFVRLKSTPFRTVFANDILREAFVAWKNYFESLGYDSSIYKQESIVDLVKMHRMGAKVFPENVDIVTGGFPCQDFSVAGKRKGFESSKDHNGKRFEKDLATEESRGRLYFWMKEVIDIVKPKIFIAENVKGLVNLSNVKDIIQKDFSTADDGGYIVLNPKVLHAANYGVPQSRERVFFIGIRKSALTPKALKELSKSNIPDEFTPYPKPTHSFSVSGNDLSSPVTLGDIFSLLEEPNTTTDFSQKIFSCAKYMGTHCQGQKEISLDTIGPTIRSEHHGNIEFRRLSKKNGGALDSELIAGLNERRLTPRECALIQTFPIDYEFVIPNQMRKNSYILSASAAYKVIGNAVPPLLAYNIAKRIESLWNIYFN